MKSFLWGIATVFATFGILFSVVTVVIGVFAEGSMLFKSILIGVGMVVFAASVWVLHTRKSDVLTTILDVIIPW